MPDFAAAAKSANKWGLPHLEEIFRRMAASTGAIPPRSKPGKPRVCMVVDHKGWCGERLSKELISNLPEYDCKIIRLGDREHIALDSDLYIYRNASWLNAVPLPAWAYQRVICIVEGHRMLDNGLGPLLRKVFCAVPMTEELADRLRGVGGINIWRERIANGVNSNEFTPARRRPREFTVGSAGNFSLEYYDNWKGFSRYVVPACKLAGVKLDWCSWQGRCYSMPGVRGKYIKPEDMSSWYKGLSCFVLMSQSEGCSGVTFEAMASGLPVISTKVGWHGENGGGGIVWAKRPKNETPRAIRASVYDLAEKLLMLKADHELCLELGRENRKFAKKYSHANIADQWRGVLRAALAAI